MKRLLIPFVIMMLMALVMGACGSEENSQDSEVESGNVSDHTEEISEEVTVTLKNNEDDNIGSAVLQEIDEGVRIKVDATHLTPGQHGFHIHETGSCEAPDFESAGGHFNPTDDDHGVESDNGPHAGDLPNIDVEENGEISDEFLAENVTLETGKDNSLLDEDGTALIIHADPDDNKSQPAGDAGDRIACGVIEK